MEFSLKIFLLISYIVYAFTQQISEFYVPDIVTVSEKAISYYNQLILFKNESLNKIN